MVKRIVIIIIGLMVLAGTVSAQTSQLKYVDGNSLTLIGKITDTPQRYYRVDTAKYGGFDNIEQMLVSESAGLALCFKTNSTQISVKSFFKYCDNAVNMTGIFQFGYDLYIRKDGQWLYAASGARKGLQSTLPLIKNMNGEEKECLLYLPAFSILDSLQIGVDENAYIRSMPNPFRHRIIFWGSSFTHGVSTNRPGMSYPLIFGRSTDMYVMNLGVSGHSKLQQSFAKVLADAQTDAFVFDAFSNPTAKEIEERFVPFVKTIREKHPNTPLIFMQTIYRESRNFDTVKNKDEQAKMDAGAKMVKEMMLHDKNVYFINPKNYTGDDHQTSTDGIHPSVWGYYRWAMTIKPLLLDILKKYDIR